MARGGGKGSGSGKSGGKSGGKPGGKSGGKSGGLTGSLGGARHTTVRVKTARRRKNSSTRWLERQLNDPYVVEARARGFRSRAAFKLLDIDDRYKFLKPGMAVVDLGCAPGGWTQIAVERVKAGKDGGGKVVGVDLLEAEQVAGATIFQADFMDDDTPDRLKALLDGPADAVLSDMAANTTGHPQTDHIRIIALAETALDFAFQVLAPGGAFVAKVFSGGAEASLLDQLKRNFQKVAHFKPPSSRKESAETYVIAIGFKGKAPEGKASGPQSSEQSAWDERENTDDES